MPGQTCHHCSAPAELQWPRHGTDTEATAHWNALEANILASGNPDYRQDRTGHMLHVTVLGCGDHALGPICEHVEAAPAPCPDCRAVPGQPCTKPDGSERPVEHPARVAAQPQPETCTHAHDADCGGYGNCQCAAGRP